MAELKAQFAHVVSKLEEITNDIINDTINHDEYTMEEKGKLTYYKKDDIVITYMKEDDGKIFKTIRIDSPRFYGESSIMSTGKNKYYVVSKIKKYKKKFTEKYFVSADESFGELQFTRDEMNLSTTETNQLRARGYDGALKIQNVVMTA